MIQLKSKKYHTVETMPNYIPLKHKYMIAHVLGLVQALQLKVDGVSH